MTDGGLKARALRKGNACARKLFKTPVMTRVTIYQSKRGSEFRVAGRT